MWLVLWIIAAAYIHSGEAVKCLECTDIPDPKYCRHLVTCGADETCSIQEIMKTTGEISYNMGCLKNSVCQATSSGSGTGARNIVDVTLCMHCCDKDYCNLEGCGKQLSSIDSRGPFCLTCSSVSSPDQCTSVHECQPTEQCLIAGTSGHYKLACETATTCLTLGSDCSGAGTCCSGDFCNTHCGSGTSTSQVGGSTNCDTSGGYQVVSDAVSGVSMCVRLENHQRHTWDDARAVCKAEGADLLVLDTLQKAILMRDALVSYTHLSYWIGMRDFDSSDTFTWVNGQPVVASESDWHAGQPNHYDAHHIQDCGIMYDGVGSHHKWHDDNCDRSYNYICQRT